MEKGIEIPLHPSPEQYYGLCSAPDASISSIEFQLELRKDYKQKEKAISDASFNQGLGCMQTCNVVCKTSII